MHPKIAIIILNWNGLADTLECVASVQKSDYADWHLYLIDNGSRDVSEGEEFVRRWGSDPRVTVIKNDENLGFTGGMNQGIELALNDSEVGSVFLLNNDAVIHLEALGRLAAAAGADPWLGGVQAAMYRYDARATPDSFGIILTTSGLSFTVTRDDQKFFCPSGGAVLYTRRFAEHLLQTDGYFFDPDFFAYAEDLDVGFRGLWYHFRFVQAPTALVYHKGSVSAKKHSSHFAMEHYLCNGLWALVKNWTCMMWFRWGWRVALTRLAIIPLYVWRGAPGVPMRAYIRAVRGLPQVLVRRRIVQLHRSRVPSTIEKMHATMRYRTPHV